MTADSTPFIIGGNVEFDAVDDVKYQWRGRLDEIVLYNRVLSLDEIQRIAAHNSPLPL